MLAIFTNGRLPILAGIQPTGLRCLGVTLFLENRSIHNRNLILCGKLIRQSKLWDKRLKPRRPFVPGARRRKNTTTTPDILYADGKNFQ